jgi:DNA-binding MarR family transcriptional regulator
MLEPMPARTSATAVLGRRVWQAMFDLLIRSAPHRVKSLARRRMTPNDSRALFSLDPREGRTMRSLADEWHCDPSNATWIVDHLEALGLAERRSVPQDLRVKLVVLTRKGRKTRTELLQEFHQPPAELAALARADLEALDRVLAKLAPAMSAEESAQRSTRSRPKAVSASKTRRTR